MKCKSTTPTLVFLLMQMLPSGKTRLYALFIQLLDAFKTETHSCVRGDLKKHSWLKNLKLLIVQALHLS
jgi:hypothetical protein